MNERMNTNEVKTEFIKRIHDNYTLNLAISMLEDFDKIGLVNNNLLIERMKLQQQLQTYKAKEDKLREYFDSERFVYVFLHFTNAKDTIKKEIKEILEGSNKDE